MTVSFVPANPGYFAVVKRDGLTMHLPVIAWRLVDLRGFQERVDVEAVGLAGVFDPECPIIGPDGTLAHE